MKLLPLAVALLAVPAVAAAQTLFSILGTVQGLLNALIPFFITLAVLYFFYGVGLYILKAGDEEARAQGRQIMINGVIGLFVIVGVWGLVGVLAETFNIETGGGIDIPTIGN